MPWYLLRRIGVPVLFLTGLTHLATLGEAEQVASWIGGGLFVGLVLGDHVRDLRGRIWPRST